MICPTCGHENPLNAKFCNNCGSSLALSCPNCGQENPPGSRFCNNCGHKLQVQEKPQAQPVTIHPPQKGRDLISKELLTQLETARTKQTMVGERRVVTMLFCDLKGSTAAAEQFDPEEWAEIINQAFEYMISPIYKYEGTVARLMGDGILAFFGAPIAHEDDPQRAVLAGLEIVTEIKPYKEKIFQQWAVDFDVRVGVNTGLVMVGQVGSDLQMEYTAVGDAINLAARMEQTAEPGTVQISAETYNKIAPLFEFEALGAVSVKGKSDPILTYRPLRPLIKPGRMRGIAGLDSPLVGRAGELEKLQLALHNLDHGNGGIVCLIGEAGLGKSRLIAEIMAIAGTMVQEKNSALRWFESSSLSYETSQPYALFQRLLRHMLGITLTESQQDAGEKIASSLSVLSQDQELFQILLGSHPQQETASLEGETYKRQLYRAMTALWDRETAQGPLLLILDDLHWADPASVELLIHLFELTNHKPLLLLCASRPDHDAPGWQIMQKAAEYYPQRFSELTLQALQPLESSALVDNLLPLSNLPPKLRQRILEKTDGNPLFVEEVVRTLIDRGVTAQEGTAVLPNWQTSADFAEVEIPDNLQSLLIARIDRLEDSERRTLQLASVIGYNFYYRVLQSIYLSDRHEDINLDHELTTLQRKELILQAAQLPEAEYLFRHMLTQEAAYSTILLRERRKFHRRVGSAIEELFPHRLEDFYLILAYHFGRGDDARAVKYEILAADRAYRIFAIPEALEHYTLALQGLQRHQLTPNIAQHDMHPLAVSETLTYLFLRRGRCLELQSEYLSALENYTEMETVARKLENQEILLPALLAKATLCAIPSPAHNPGEGQVLAEKALIIARELGDQRSEAKLLWVFMLLKIYSGFMVDGIPFGEGSAALSRQLDMPEQLGHSLQDLGLAYIAAGRLSDADKVLQEARPLWEKLNDLPMLAENWANTVYLRVSMADFEDSLRAEEESTNIALAIENKRGLINARAFIVLVYIARGEIDRALELAESVIDAAEIEGHPGHTLGWFYRGWIYNQIGAHQQAQVAAERGFQSSLNFPPFHPLSLAMSARQAIQAGDFNRAGELLLQADQPGLRQTLQMIDIQVDMATAEFHLAQANYAQVQEQLTILLDKLTTSGARYFLPYTLRLQAHLIRAQGMVSEANTLLQIARDSAIQNGDRFVLWPILADLGEKEASFEVVEFIAGNIADKGLRQTFLEYAQNHLEL